MTSVPLSSPSLLRREYLDRPPCSRVTVRTSTLRAGCLLEVEDEGPGISEAERSKVMERFYRPAGSAGDGCGLGLAIVQEIAQLHGGHIDILGTPDRTTGTLLRVSFSQLRNQTNSSANP